MITLNINKASQITSLYPLEGKLIEVAPIGDGHINDTWVVSFSDSDSDSFSDSDSDSDFDEASKRYCLQRINHHVFTDVEGLMSNIEKVTEHLYRAVLDRKGDSDRESLRLCSAKNGHKFVKYDHHYYRLYNYIENSFVPSCGSKTGLDSAHPDEDFCHLESPYLNTLFKAGSAFASFLGDLSTYSGPPLVDTIPEFHNTVHRYQTFLDVVKKDAFGRAASVANEISFVKDRVHITSVIVDGLQSGDIPVRISHNDTKINNVLFDNDTGDVLCVIDLDTIMHGSVLYDFGDAVRIAASTGDEDEQNLAIVTFSLNSFKALAQGFMSSGKEFLTDGEVELLPMSAVIMALEIGMRFLTDYLEGDTYFKIERSDHNLHRCRTQFKMVSEMEDNFDAMKSVIKELR